MEERECALHGWDPYILFHGSLEFGGLDSRKCIIRVHKLLTRLNVSHVFVPEAPLALFQRLRKLDF